jgi:KipI family sensor histidine kinase inhibitor
MSTETELLVGTRDRPHVSFLGTAAMLFEAPGEFNVSNQRRIWALARTVETWAGIKEAAPGMTNLMLTFETPPKDPALLESNLLNAWDEADELVVDGKTVDIPVTYGGELGPHLEEAAKLTGLTVDELVEIHASTPYTVFALGAHPGLGYLGITDRRIWVPRRKVPILSVPEGSVSIGGMQTAVSASPGPSGWHTLGHTETSFFFPDKDPPTLLAPGDTVVFRIERIIR